MARVPQDFFGDDLGCRGHGVLPGCAAGRVSGFCRAGFNRGSADAWGRGCLGVAGDPGCRRAEITCLMSGNQWNVKTGFAKIRDRAFPLDEADIVEASRKNPQASDKNKSWTITVKPDGNDAISITLPETTNCSSNRGICTHDERKLSHSTSASIAGPVGITVGDARVQEAAGAVLTFAVALSRTPTSDVSVDYATSDGTAEAGAD